MGNILLSLLVRFGLIYRISSYWEIFYFHYWRDLVRFAECGPSQLPMLSAFGSSGLGFRFGLVPGAWVFHCAYFFFGPREWACAPFFQTPSADPSSFLFLQRSATSKACRPSLQQSYFSPDDPVACRPACQQFRSGPTTPTRSSPVRLKKKHHQLAPSVGMAVP